MFDLVIAPKPYFRSLCLFLAGGITGCSDWQAECIASLQKESNDRGSRYPLVLFNPRRADFDTTDPSMSERQIEWEHEMLTVADAVLFWFPPETLCPITLFELGKIATGKKHLFVGCHKDYKRREDVRIQLQLIRPEVKVRNDLKYVVADVMHWIAGDKSND